MRMADLLGHCCWYFIHDGYPTCRLVGSEKTWSNRNATLQELVDVLPRYERIFSGRFQLTEWQKVGRKIQEVAIKEMRYEVNVEAS